MTSQIILGNGHGIALASDSAVTMGRSRTYDTSEKIYPLPYPHCIAVLHAGNVHFHGMPYTTLINEWAKSLGGVPLRSVPYYVESFRKFLVDEMSGWVSESDLARDFISALGEEFSRIYHDLRPGDSPLDETGALAIWRKEVGYIESLEDEFSLGQSHKRWADAIFQKFLPGGAFGKTWSITELIEYWFDDVARSEEIDKLIHQYAWLSISKHYPTSDVSRALLTFTGYGLDHIVPAYVSLAMFGAIEQTIVWDMSEVNWAVRTGGGMYLLSLSGQTDAIDLFFRGYDINLVEATKAAVSGALHDAEAAPADGPPTTQSIEDYSTLNRAIEGTFERFAESSSLSALRHTIAGMPLGTLASTARRVIDLQSLSLDIRGRLPTVGGPVRTGVITKSGGFEWLTS